MTIRHALTTQKENFVFLPTHFKRKKEKASPHFSTFVFAPKGKNKRAKISLPACASLTILSYAFNHTSYTSLSNATITN